MRKFDRILCGPRTGDCLDTVPPLFSLSDGPANRIYRHGPITKVSDPNIQMFFWRSSISTDNEPEPSKHLKPNTLTPASKMKRHKDGSKCCNAGDPCADGIPDLNLLIECHSAESGIANFGWGNTELFWV